MIVFAWILVTLPSSDAVKCYKQNACAYLGNDNTVKKVFGKVFFFPVVLFILKFLTFLAENQGPDEYDRCNECYAYSCYKDRVYYSAVGCKDDDNICNRVMYSFEASCSSDNPECANDKLLKVYFNFKNLYDFFYFVSVQYEGEGKIPRIYLLSHDKCSPSKPKNDENNNNPSDPKIDANTNSPADPKIDESNTSSNGTKLDGNSKDGNSKDGSKVGVMAVGGMLLLGWMVAQ